MSYDKKYNEWKIPKNYWKKKLFKYIGIKLMKKFLQNKKIILSGLREANLIRVTIV